MIGLVIVSHGGLADAFKLALEQVAGLQQQIETVAIGPDDDLEERSAEIHAAIRRADAPEGVVVVTDMFGSTPSNPRPTDSATRSGVFPTAE